MARALFSLLLLAASVGSYAQSSNTVLYGILKTNNNPGITFARIDALTGLIINQNSVSDPYVSVFGSSAFASGIDAAYHIQGAAGITNNFKMYRIDADSLVVEDAYAQPIVLNDPVYDMQHQQLIGIVNPTGSVTGPNEVVKQDPITGEDTVVAIIYGIQGYVAGAATYDADNSIYYINGIDFAGQSKLVAVYMTTGVVKRKNLPLVGDQHLTNLEYDNNTGVLYGIYRDNGLAYIAAVDTQTAAITPRVPLNQVVNQFAQNASVYDHLNARYILFSPLNNGNGKIVTIDMTADSVIAQANIAGFLQEMEYDNSSFAVAKYGAPQSTEEPTLQPKGGSVYPNPTSDYIYLSHNKPVQIRVTDRMGRVVLVKQFSGEAIDVQVLPAGMYWLSYKEADQPVVIPFVKQ